MAGTTSNFGVRYPEAADAVNVETDIAEPYEEFDQLIAGRAAADHTHADMATDAEVAAAVAALVDSSPAALNTLNELAAAIGDDANFAATMTTALAGKASTADLATHAADTSSVHGVTDMTALLDASDHALIDHAGIPGVGTEGINAAIAEHSADTTAVHGIDDTSLLATTTAVTAAIAAAALVTANRQTDSYTLVASDANKVVEMNKATANALTLPPDVFTAGQFGEGVQWGAGQTTITPGAGVTIRSSGGKLKTTAQYSSFTWRCVASNEFIVAGELST